VTDNPNELTVENSAVVLLQQGGGVGLALEYMVAQLAADIVPAPDGFAAEAARSGIPA
jgi:hypothetical protein